MYTRGVAIKSMFVPVYFRIYQVLADLKVGHLAIIQILPTMTDMSGNQFSYRNPPGVETVRRLYTASQANNRMHLSVRNAASVAIVNAA
mmetsp:Transcript_9049/g.13602  ORF Transcript_9049/g.13602 Transcript_9049/m.13602 type:complete len:89 (+) Transcript_9049:402-668(+)